MFFYLQYLTISDKKISGRDYISEYVSLSIVESISSKIIRIWADPDLQHSYT